VGVALLGQALLVAVVCLMGCVVGSCRLSRVRGDSSGRPVSVEVETGL